MDQSQEILLGHAIFVSSEYRTVTVVLHVRLAIKSNSYYTQLQSYQFVVVLLL